eukprot:TRINITY_DN1684_c0_g1_i1.p1 TRINITY_DN1684_c0_g1~~TRINITY_DN1684_c0_g1_i1.p1  ORF type:complete len:346 (+),score=33.68 TRINITY_DN1684_c0_g1_i1:81-1118(+)
MLYNLVKFLLLVSPFLSRGLLFDSLNIADGHQSLGKSPCDPLQREFCTAQPGCSWYNNGCDARIAWLHVMKCGSSFGTTLAHYANLSLPFTSHIPSGRDQSDPEDRTTEGDQGEPNFFKFKYPTEQWFKNVFRNPENPGNHLPIMEDEWDYWRGNWFGLFREPASRVLSSFYHFGRGEGNMLNFARKIKGQQASMLSTGMGGMAKIRCEFNQEDAPGACQHMVIPDVPLALQRLDGFGFVGIVEEYELAVCLFHAMFGSPCLPVEFLNMRPGEYPGGKEKKERELAMLRAEGDPWDDPVYDYARRRFWGDVRQYNLKPSVCRSICPAGMSFNRGPLDLDEFLQPY